MCLHALKTKHYSRWVPIVGTVGYNIGSYWDLCFKQLSSFLKAETKGRQVWPLPRETKGPAIRHCLPAAQRHRPICCIMATCRPVFECLVIIIIIIIVIILIFWADTKQLCRASARWTKRGYRIHVFDMTAIQSRSPKLYRPDKCCRYRSRAWSDIIHPNSYRWSTTS